MLSFSIPKSLITLKGKHEKTFLYGLLVLFFCTSGLNAQTTIPDKANVSGIWTLANSPYLVEGTVTVPEGQTLIIEPGVEIRFKARELGPLIGVLHVNGKLLAQGSSTQKIKFTRLGDEGYWKGILIASSSDSSIMDHVCVEYACGGNAVWISNPSTILTNSLIWKNNLSGVGVDRGGTFIANNVIAENGSRGVNISNSGYLNADTVKFFNNTVIKNKAEGMNIVVACLAVNNIFWGNSKSFYNDNIGYAEVSNCLIEEDSLALRTDKGKLKESNIFNANPHIDAQYKLLDNSPCINAGHPELSIQSAGLTDFHGKNRVVSDVIDMGASESSANHYLRLVSPKRDEMLLPASSIKLQWEGNVGSVRLDYKEGEGDWTEIIANSAGANEFNWTLPNKISDNYQVRIRSINYPQLVDSVDAKITVVGSIIPAKSELKGRLTIENSPYNIDGFVTVPSGETLVIDPGVELRFKTEVSSRDLNDTLAFGFLKVEGKLIAKGNANQKIKFTRQGHQGNWGVVEISSTADTNTVIDHCIFEYSGFVFLGSNRYVYRGAVNIRNQPRISISNTLFKHNVIGINSFYSTPRIYNCVFDQNEQGIKVYNLYGNAWDKPIQIINSTFIDYLDKPSITGEWASFDIINCIFTGPHHAYFKWADLQISHCIMDKRGVSFRGEPYTLGEGMIFDIDPQLNEDYSLKSNSPAINAGTTDIRYGLTSVDFFGNVRNHLGKVDIGASEALYDSYAIITSPDKKVGVIKGAKLEIKWRSNASQIKLLYSTNEDNWHTIADNVNNEGSYSWQLPDTLNGSFKLRLEDATDPMVYDLCDHSFESIHSNISHNTVLKGRLTKENSPYTIKGKVTVPYGDTLIIDPGVTIQFNTGADVSNLQDVHIGQLVVDGTLLAEGNESEQITLTRNKAYGYWGGLAINSKSNTTSILDHAIVEFGGGSGATGAIAAFGKAVIKNCIIRDNQQAGLYLRWHAECQLSHNLITNNEIGIYLYLTGNFAGSMDNNTIVGNSLYGIRTYGSGFEISNNILWNNGKSFYNKRSGPSYRRSISYSLVDNSSMDGSELTNLLGEGNIIGIDPLFIDPANSDFQLQNVSPCVDAGDPNSAYDLEPSDNGGRINMGCYGNTSLAVRTESLPRIRSVAPSSISILGGDTLLVKGDGFLDQGANSKIRFGEKKISDILFWENDSIVFITPTMTASPDEIKVSNKLGATGGARGAIEVLVPTLEEVFPAFTLNGSSKRIQIKGHNFGDAQGSSKIFFGSIESPGYVSWSDTLITLACPADGQGIVNLKFELAPGIEFLFENSFLYAEQDVIEVCGEVSGTWEQGKTYLLTCPSTVPKGQSLIIEPGTVIMANYNLSNLVALDVQGSIEAIGTENAPIEFKGVRPLAGSWQGISLNAEAASFDYCNIKHAVNGLDIKGKGVELRNSTISNNLETGVKYYIGLYNGEILIEDTELMNNDNGIVIEADIVAGTFLADATLSRVQVYDNTTDGIRLLVKTHPDVMGEYLFFSSWIKMKIEDSEIRSNQNQGIGIYVDGYYDNGDPDEGYAYGTFYGSVILEIENSIFSENRWPIKAHRKSLYYSNYELVVKNSVFYNNQEPIDLDQASARTYGFLDLSDIEPANAVFINTSFWESGRSIDIIGRVDSLVNCNLNQLDNVPGSGNISADPLYTDPTAGDFSVHYNSPNLDAGTNLMFHSKTDLKGNPRIVNSTGTSVALTDIGAYEFQGTISEEAAEICQGDEYNGWTEPGEYAKELTSQAGADSIVVVSLKVNPLPTAPKIDISDDVAISDQTQSNQWCRNQEPLAGEEAQELVIDQAGKYHATATDDKGCVSLASNALDVYTEAVEICEGEEYEGWTAAGNYSRKLVSSQGDSIVITGLTVNPLPAQPKITQDNDTLYSSADSGNQWFLDDEQIEGANSESHVAEQSGSYHIVVTNAHGCASEPSEKLQVTLTSIGAPDASQLQIYPNPIEDELFVTGIDLAKPAKLRIYDELGTLVHEQELSNGQARIKLGHLPKGSYFLLFQGHEQNPIKLIKK